MQHFTRHVRTARRKLGLVWNHQSHPQWKVPDNSSHSISSSLPRSFLVYALHSHTSWHGLASESEASRCLPRTCATGQGTGGISQGWRYFGMALLRWNGGLTHTHTPTLSSSRSLLLTDGQYVAWRAGYQRGLACSETARAAGAGNRGLDQGLWAWSEIIRSQTVVYVN